MTRYVDLDGGGIGSSDRTLELPRLSPWTYGANVVHDLELGTLSSRLSYNRRDRAFYTDNNIRFLNEVDIWSGGP